MTRVSNAIAVATAIFAAAAYADMPPLSFKGIEIGKSTLEDVKTKFPGATTYGSLVHADPSAYADSKCGTLVQSVRDPSISKCRGDAITDQLFRIGQTSSGDFFFEAPGGGTTIEEVRATFTTSSFSAVTGALREKYGTPTSTASEEFKTRAGATFPTAVLTWELPDGIIQARERSGKVDTMRLVMSSKRILSDRAEEARKSVKDAAKAL